MILLSQQKSFSQIAHLHQQIITNKAMEDETITSSYLLRDLLIQRQLLQITRQRLRT